MRRYFSRFILICLISILLLIYLRFPPQSSNVIDPSPTVISHPSSIRTHDFRFYQKSRSANEFHHLEIDDRIQSMFFSIDSNREEPDSFDYSESKFRSASVPIIWLDKHGDVRWNRAAQGEMLDHLMEKQFPPMNITECPSHRLFILDQWSMGFFSRYHCFIEHFGQTMYSPRMTLLASKRFYVSNADQEDFQGEGILRYYQPFSLCASYLDHPVLKSLKDRLAKVPYSSSETEVIHDVHQLLETQQSKMNFKYSRDIWKYGYEHIPHRRWLFDRKRYGIRERIQYDSDISSLIDHSDEHIYVYSGADLDLKKWSSRNAPQGPPSNVLNGTTTNLTMNDQIFTSFLRYMLVLFFSPLAPRIQISAKLLAHHWSEYLSDQHKKPFGDALKNMAAIFIRRGDKMPEDSFWQKYGRWRNISMYVKGLVDEEKRRKIKYNSIFIMTDDLSVMSSMQTYAREGLSGAGKDESYARQHLHGRQILYNVFAPQACFNPFVRIGFDQFLVNVLFVTDYASIIVGHTDSNVGRYLEELVYVQRQHNPDIQATTHVFNAPDSLD